MRKEYILQKYLRFHDLASVLGVSELTVRLMETQGKGLDSMKRRRLVAAALNIPPVLLELNSLEDLFAYLQETTSTRPQTALKKTPLFHDALGVYWDAHYIGTVSANIPTVNTWVQCIRQETSGEHQQSLLCEWYLLLAHMYADKR